jgi:hypothetical protein
MSADFGRSETIPITKFVLKESATNLFSESFEWKLEADNPNRDELLELTVDVIENTAMIAQVLNEIANPKSPNYGKTLSKDEISRLALLPEDKAIVLNWIRSFPDHTRVHYKERDGAEGSHIAVIAPLSTWENQLFTTFHFYSKKTNPAERVIRAEEYSLPEAVASSVAAVHPVVQFPLRVHHGPLRTAPKAGPGLGPAAGPALSGTGAAAGGSAFNREAIRINPGLVNIAAGGTVHDVNQKPQDAS